MTTIYKDVPVPIEHKTWHIHKIGKTIHRDFTKDYGDVPVGSFNKITNKFEEAVNTRGLSYATRKRKMFRKNRKDIINAKREIY